MLTHSGGKRQGEADEAGERGPGEARGEERRRRGEASAIPLRMAERCAGRSP